MTVSLPPMRPIRPSPGGQLARVDIVGRDDDAARIWRAVTDGTASILISAPRRIGKTRTTELVCAAPPPGWAAAGRSLQGVDTLLGLAETLLAMIAEHQSVGRRLWDRIKPFLRDGTTAAYGEASITLAIPFQDDPIASIARILHVVDEHLGDEHLLLVCDELPDMIDAIRLNEGDEAARRAFGLFRSWRDTALGDEPSAIRWLVTGSVGLHHVLRKIGDRQDLTNDLYSVPLSTLEPAWAEWLTAALLRGAGIADPDDDAVRLLAKRSNGFAMVLHLVTARIRDRQISDIDTTDVDPLLDQVFGDLDASHQFTSFVTRLPDHYDDDAMLAGRVLDVLATGSATRPALLARLADGVAPRDEDHLRTLLDWLTLDHYIDHDDAGTERTYAWRYGILARLWRIRRR